MPLGGSLLTRKNYGELKKPKSKKKHSDTMKDKACKYQAVPMNMSAVASSLRAANS